LTKGSLSLWLVAFVQKVGWDHLFLLAIPTHHSVGPPAFVGHIDGDDTCETKFDWAVEGFTVSKMVVQIGMVRFYLRELHNNAQGVLEPTGKVVAFPNSILFQPSAFYKYVG
jgi:hypothetical protein